MSALTEEVAVAVEVALEVAVEVPQNKRKAEEAALDEPDYKTIAMLALADLNDYYYGEHLGLNIAESREAFDSLFRKMVKTADGKKELVARNIERDMPTHKQVYLEYLMAFAADPELTYISFCERKGWVTNSLYISAVVKEGEEEEA